MPSAPERDESAHAGSQQRRWLAVVGTIVVLGFAGVLAARTIDLGETLAAVREADVRLLGLAVAVYVASLPLRGQRYGDVLAPMDRRLHTGFLTLAVLLSQTANLVLPARAGDGVRAYVCNQRRGVSYPSGAASLTVERCFDLLALGVIGAGSSLALLVTAPASTRRTASDAAAAVPLTGLRLVAVLLLGGVVATAAVVLASTTGGRRSLTTVGGLAARAVGNLASRLAERLPQRAVDALRTDAPRTDPLRTDALRTFVTRAREGARAVAADLSTVAARPRTLATVGASSLAIWLLDAATAVLVLGAVSAEPLSALFVVGTLAVVAGNVAKVLPLTQGGLGLYEGAFVATVVAVSPVAPALALAAAVLDHGLKNVVTLAGGVLAGVLLQISPASAGHSDAR